MLPSTAAFFTCRACPSHDSGLGLTSTKPKLLQEKRNAGEEQLLAQSGKNERWSGSDWEWKVALARGEDVLTSLRCLQVQRAYGRCFPSGHSLWYYISLLYFTDPSIDPQSVPVTHPAHEVVVQELLRDLGRESLDDIQTRCERELRELQENVTQLLPSFTVKTYSELQREERILDLVKGRNDRKDRNDYLLYEEKRALERVPADCCAVCGGGDSVPPDDWIVICSGCEVAVHMQCFGLKVLPEHDWFCDVCRLRPESPTCGICLQSGGISKATIHERNWPYAGNDKEKLWAHLYCAQVIGANFLLPDSKDLLDLATVSVNRWNREVCEVCESPGGVCLACSMCEVGFHPECWRKIHPGPVGLQTACLCRRHYPRISIATLSLCESYLVKEVLTFCRLLNKRQCERKAQLCRGEFSHEENSLLLDRVEAYLHTVNSQRNFGFSITIQQSSGAVKIERPEMFNIVAPDALTHADVSVPGRSAEQCLEQYTALYPWLLRRLRRPRVELRHSSQFYQVVKKRRLVKRHCEPLETVVRLPLCAVKDTSSSSTQDLSEDDFEAYSYT